MIDCRFKPDNDTSKHVIDKTKNVIAVLDTAIYLVKEIPYSFHILVKLFVYNRRMFIKE